MKRYDLYKRSIHDTSSMAIRKTGGWVEYSEAKGIISNLTQGVTVLTNRIITLEEQNKEMLSYIKNMSNRLSWTLGQEDDIRRATQIINKIEANNG